MKFNAKIIVIVISVFLFLCSTSIAANLTQSDRTHLKKNECVIDSNVLLTKKDMTLLKKSLNKINNSIVKTLINEIILNLEKKERINCHDFEDIIQKLNLPIKGIHTGRLFSHGPGYALTCPGLFLQLGLFRFPYWGPSIIGNFYGMQTETDTAITKINLIERYRGNHQGFIIGFFGISFSPIIEEENDYSNWYGIRGTALIIIVV